MSPKGISDVSLKRFASFAPTTVIDNKKIIETLNSAYEPEILYRTVGSRKKHAVLINEMGSDMMAKVGLQILQESNTPLADIDKLICSCDPQDQAAPDAAVVTQAKIGLACPAFGVSMSCPSWLCGILVGCGFLQGGDRRVLVLSASTVGSKYIFRNPVHRSIFGDGAGGVLLERQPGANQILALDLWTNGGFYKEIFAPHQWTATPKEIPSEYTRAFFMAPDNKVFYDAIDQHIKPFYLKQYDEAKILPKDISIFIVHQASMPIFRHTLKSLSIPENKTFGLFDEYGNTVSAELPMLIDQAIHENRIRKGDLVYALTYGAGFTAGAMIFRA